MRSILNVRIYFRVCRGLEDGEVEESKDVFLFFKRNFRIPWLHELHAKRDFKVACAVIVLVSATHGYLTESFCFHGWYLHICECCPLVCRRCGVVSSAATILLFKLPHLELRCNFTRAVSKRDQMTFTTWPCHIQTLIGRIPWWPHSVWIPKMPGRFG